CSLFPDVASCLSYARLAPDVSIPAAVNAGKASYDGARAHDCVEKTAQRSCDLTTGDLRAQLTSCGAVFTGLVDGGQPCSLDAECASGTCVLPSNCPESGCCVGACRAGETPGGVGEACAKDRDCRSHLVCARSRMCRTLSAVGEDCGGDHECAAGLAC